ncbi:MAG: CgeB family protein [Actinomycetota bacterium]
MKADYGHPSRGLSYEHVQFYGTLAEAGYEVAHFDFMDVLRRRGRGRMNELLRESASQSLPDLALFVIFEDEIEPATIAHLRSLGIITANWFTDDHWRYDDFSKVWAPHFDYAITTSAVATESYEEDGSNAIPSQWGFNPYVFRSYADRERRPDLDIIFVGQPHSNRRETIENLRSAGLRVDTFGHGWPSGKVSYTRMLDLFQRSKIALGLSGSSTGVSQIKGRDFEVPAVGALYLTTRNPELSSFFVEGEEIACYSGSDELVETCRRLLTSEPERERIAAAGKMRAWTEHSYVSRFSAIFAAMDFQALGAEASPETRSLRK